MIVTNGSEDHKNKAIEELSSYPQWVGWKRRGKRKIPVSPRTGKNASSTNPATWGTLESLTEKSYPGIGFTLTQTDPFGCIDLDDCIDLDTGEVAQDALAIVEAYGSYTERSPSGAGLHIWIRCEAFENLSKTDGIEAYFSKRYITFTGDVFRDSPIREIGVRDSRIVCAAMDARYSKSIGEPFKGTQTPHRANQRDDHDIIELCRKSYGGEFDALYDRGERGEDASVADYRLMRKLAWASGNDPDTMIRLFQSSALASNDPTRGEPDKYMRRDYLARTAAAAIRRTPEPYDTERRERRKPTARETVRANHHHAIHSHDWRGCAGRASAAGTDYAVYMTLLEIAHDANSTEIGASERRLMLEAGIGSRNTVRASLRRLESNHMLLERADGMGRYTLYSKLHHSPKNTTSSNQHCAYNDSGAVLSKLFRHPTPEMPEYDRNGRRIPQSNADSVRSVGKASAWILALVEAGYSDLDKLANRTGIRRDNLKYREIKQLLDAGLIVARGDGYATADNLEGAILRELYESGCIAKMERAEQRIERERRTYRVRKAARRGYAPDWIGNRYGYSRAEIMHILTPPNSAPTEHEMEERRTARNADGVYGDLARHDETFEAFNYCDEREPTLGAA